MSIYLCVYIYIYIYMIYVHIYIYIHTYTYTHIHIYIYMYIHMFSITWAFLCGLVRRVWEPLQAYIIDNHVVVLLLLA